MMRGVPADVSIIMKSRLRQILRPRPAVVAKAAVVLVAGCGIWMFVSHPQLAANHHQLVSSIVDEVSHLLRFIDEHDKYIPEAILLAIAWALHLRRRVCVQNLELQKAGETAIAIKDLSAAMEAVSEMKSFGERVSVRGSTEVAQLVIGFNNMLSELERREREKSEAEAQLHVLALTDPLTSLPNRRLLSDRLTQTLELAKRENRLVGLLYLDLDGFKLVNDGLGHAAGDKILTEASQRLLSRLRKSDTLARIGGDEFAIVLTEVKTAEDAGRVAQSLLDVLSLPFKIGEHNITIGASIGISVHPNHSDDVETLLQQADSAMYAAKREGKNRAVYFTRDLGDSMRERMTLESELRRALVDNEITVHYQPEFDLNSGRIVRFEALARWSHPTLGQVPPSKFIPIAEEMGVIVPLGVYILECACREALTWQEMSDHPIQVAVNVSSVQFSRDSFVDDVLDVLQRTGLTPTLLQIELTEAAMVRGAERATRSMQRLRSIGVSVAIDDFGTGYSALGHLPKLVFDALKIDRTFVREVGSRPENKAMVQSLLTLAHNLGMNVIVAGIETQEQLEVIRSLGGSEVQGFLLGRPTADPASHLCAPPVGHLAATTRDARAAAVQ